jgi:hypothetical protein
MFSLVWVKAGLGLAIFNEEPKTAYFNPASITDETNAG